MENDIKSTNNLIRREIFTGSPKVIIGDKFSDIVLETLGKVYIKSGRQLNLLSDIVNQISQTSKNDLKNKTIIVSSLEELNNMEYPGEGYFIFNKTTGILYISLNNRYIALINASEFSESGYVKKSGDTMTGPLEIKSNDANLIISSNKLIKNLNSSYLNGFTDLDFAKRNKDEKINGNWNIEGKWNFNKPTVFNENIRSKKDYITDGSLSSPEFASGFSGYGWKLDASTNTFTIDNLVVRKLMMVYEMVINKIMATNGSLWISNSSKIEKIHKVNFIIPDRLQLINYSGEISKLVKDEDDYIINNGIKPDQYYLSVYPQLVNGSNLSSSTTLGTNKIKLIPRELHYINSTEVQIRPINQGDEIVHVITYTQGEGYPINEDVISSSFEAEVENTNVKIFTYLKYFANSFSTIPNCYIIETDPEEYPMFREGDILRCQKYSLGAMKYYDAIVLLHIADRSYLIQVAESVFDKYTEFEYDENGNLIDYKEEYNETLYNKTNKALNDNGEYVYTSKSYENEDGSYNGESSLGTIQEGDDLVQIGNIYNTDRQGALYLTATDDQGPYMDILDGINRPDYSVLYKTGDKEYNKPTKVRLGKLDGIYNPIFKGNQPKGYGLYGENVYLTGEFYLNNGKSVASFAEDIQLIVGDLDSTITEKVKEQTDILKEDFVQHDDLENAGMYIDNDSIVLWADAVKIATEKADMNNPSKYTALFTDGKLSAQVFEAVAYTKEGYNSNYELVIDNICRPLIGYTGNDVNNPDPEKPFTNNRYENGNLTINSSNNLIFKKLDSEGYDVYWSSGSFSSFTGSLDYNSIPTNTTSITFSNIIYSKENYNFYAPNEHFYQENPYPVLTINKLGKGETIYYYPSGYVMNCKVFKNTNYQVSGCIEYFFNNYICTLNDVLGGYDLLKDKFPTETNGCVAIVDYFKDPINDIQLYSIDLYKWYYWDGDFSEYKGPYSVVNKLANFSEDVGRIASRCNENSERFSLYYIRDLHNSGKFVYKDIEYNVKNYFYNSLECSTCIANILTNGITDEELFLKWESYIDLSGFTERDTNNIQSNSDTLCFVKNYSYKKDDSATLTLIPINQGANTISSIIDFSTVIQYNFIKQ